jgi:hypothetical protein
MSMGDAEVRDDGDAEEEEKKIFESRFASCENRKEGSKENEKKITGSLCTSLRGSDGDALESGA